MFVDFFSPFTEIHFFEILRNSLGLINDLNRTAGMVQCNLCFIYGSEWMMQNSTATIK